MSVSVIIPLLAVILIFTVVYLAVSWPGRILKQKFNSMGDMVGLTKEEIIAHCGKYHSIRRVRSGTVCAWMATGFSFSVVFDADNRAVKVCAKTYVKVGSIHEEPLLSH